MKIVEGIWLKRDPLTFNQMESIGGVLSI